MKEKLLKQIADLAEIQKTLEPACREYCADESIPVDDRWQLFKVAPNKEDKSFYEIPDNDEVGLEEEISPYDDWYLDRYQTFDVVSRLTDWESGQYNPYTKETVDKFKNYYMKKYIGSWMNDW